MGADAYAGPVGRRLGVGPRVAVFDQRVQKFIDHVRVTAAVAAALAASRYGRPELIRRRAMVLAHI